MVDSQKNKLLVDKISDLAAFSLWVKQSKPDFNLTRSSLHDPTLVISEFNNSITKT